MSLAGGYSKNQFVLIRARKSRGGEWSSDELDVRDSHGKVVGCIILHPVHNRAYSATREQAMQGTLRRLLSDVGGRHFRVRFTPDSGHDTHEMIAESRELLARIDKLAGAES